MRRPPLLLLAHAEIQRRPGRPVLVQLGDGVVHTPARRAASVEDLLHHQQPGRAGRTDPAQWAADLAIEERTVGSRALRRQPYRRRLFQRQAESRRLLWT